MISLVVTRDAFEGLGQLVSLDLSANPVKMGGPGQGAAGGPGQVLCTLPNLQELHLAAAYLTSLDDIGTDIITTFFKLGTSTI